MKRKNRRKRILVVSAIVGFLYAILTGGLVFSDSKDFGGQRNVVLVEGLRCDFWLAPEFSEWHIPFVCHYFGSTGPYGLRIQIWDTSKSFSGIEVKEVVVRYADDISINHTEEWNRTLKEHTQTNSSSSGIVRTEMLKLSDTIEGVVARHGNVTVTIKGRLLKTDGTSVDFSTSEDFKAESDFRVTTYWEVLASI